MAKIKTDLVVYDGDERRILGTCVIPIVNGSIYNPLVTMGEDALEVLGLQLDICVEDRTYEVVIKRIEDVSNSGDRESDVGGFWGSVA